MKTLAELRALAEKTRQHMGVRNRNVKFQIMVAMGTCGIAAGARKVMSALLDEIAKKDLQDINITQTGCLGYCDQEPLVQVLETGRSPITYGKVNEKVARQIIADHLEKGKILTEYVFMTQNTN